MREQRLIDLKEQARRKAQLQSAGYGRLTTVPDTDLLARLCSVCDLDTVYLAAVHAYVPDMNVANPWGGKMCSCSLDSFA